MAKGNLFQGMAHGKVGDVVFSRLNGEQISRVRNRHPKNPRTPAQLYQRAIMATVMRAYSAGKRIFDHSFQGANGSAANQRKFMSENAKLLRSWLAHDINNALAADETTARCVAPGSLSPVAFDGMIVSQGSYEQRAFAISYDNLGVGSFRLPTAAEGQSKCQYAAATGLLVDDIYTIVVFADDTNNIVFTIDDEPGFYGQQLLGTFEFIRLRVKADFVSSTDPMTNAVTLADIFVQEESTWIWNPGFKTLPYNTVLNAEWILPTQDWRGRAAIIRSRTDQDLRSNSELFRLTAETSGISSEYVLAAWQAGTVSLGESELILEGGDI